MKKIITVILFAMLISLPASAIMFVNIGGNWTNGVDTVRFSQKDHRLTMWIDGILKLRGSIEHEGIKGDFSFNVKGTHYENSCKYNLNVSAEGYKKSDVRLHLNYCSLTLIPTAGEGCAKTSRVSCAGTYERY